MSADFLNEPHGPKTKGASDQSSPFRFGMRHMISAVFYCALAFWLIAVTAAPVVGGSLLVVVALVVGASVLVARRRSTRQDALIDILAIAADQGMSLAPALEAFSEQCGGRFRRRVLAMATDLKDGMPLPDALDRQPGVLPRDVDLFARLGWETGQLGGTLREAGSNRNALKPVWASLAWRLQYIACVLAVMQIIMSFLMYFIIPKFEAIFSEFRIPLPAMTRSAVSLGRLVYGQPGVLAVIVLIELGLLILLPGTFFGWSRAGIPFANRLLWRRHTAPILRALAWVVESGRPLSWGVRAVAGWYPTRWVRRRLNRVAQDVEHGIDWSESLHAHGLIGSSDLAVIESAKRVGNLTWALRETAESGERRLAYRYQLWIQSFFPFVLLLIGGFIGFLGVAYFVPLVSLIERLSG